MHHANHLHSGVWWWCFLRLNTSLNYFALLCFAWPTHSIRTVTPKPETHPQNQKPVCVCVLDLDHPFQPFKLHNNLETAAKNVKKSNIIDLEQFQYYKLFIYHLVVPFFSFLYVYIYTNLSNTKQLSNNILVPPIHTSIVISTAVTIILYGMHLACIHSCIFVYLYIYSPPPP